MAKRIGGSRHSTRDKFSRHRRNKGKISMSRALQTFKVGDKVGLSADGSVQKGIYHPRFHGKAGIVTGIRGTNYEVAVKDINKQKTVVVSPSHLVKIE